ncbi:phage tail tape measure protein [Angustibacter luteus]|uniref:Phage tail tape measure protein n=1 Tax=Angustibacter luteus TaxID=658456 RepID=A0ABW1JJS7_9ACTN
MATSIVFDIIAKDRASKTFKGVSKSIEGTEKSTHSLRTAATVGLAAGAGAAVAFGKTSIDKFQAVAKETVALKRYLGSTTEEASRWRYAAGQSGVGSDALGKGLGILNKHLAGNDKAWKSAGISARDSSGNLKPMTEILPQLSDKFAGMKDGPEKTALAMKLFGKAGVGLLPFLSKGSDAIASLGKESDQFGNTLSDKDTAAVKENTIAKRKWDAAITGVQIQLGQKLFPALTKVSTAMARGAKFVKDHSSATKTAVTVIGLLVGAFWAVSAVTKAYAAIQAVLNAELWANPIGVVVLALLALGAGLFFAYKKSETFRNIVNGAFKVVGAAAKFLWTDVIRVYFKLVADLWLTVAGVIIHGAALAFGWIPGIGKKIRGFADKFDEMRDRINHALAGTKDYKAVRITTPGADKAIAKLAAIRWQQNHIDPTITIRAYTKANQADAADHRAGGGPVQAGVPYIVGEHRPELFVPDQDGTILPSVPGPRRGGGAAVSGGATYVLIEVKVAPGGELAAARAIEASLMKLKQSKGRLEFQR